MNKNDAAKLLSEMGINLSALDPKQRIQLSQMLKTIKSVNDITSEDIKRISRLFSKSNKQDRTKKIPRNSKCPCGSGVKWKKCCGQNS